eukprot:TRINITY_DN62145_c0_g1_i2.p2 TRINITY_DN62145_c0_g1~~TRINITY_DN62145_c0_g1_i2.p2  ORF type:complete len:166 (+),score=64.68 TRINITY_DN62145_c0_g1_i2:372-869(+)
MDRLPALKRLYLQGNEIASVSDLVMLPSKVPRLERLSLQNADGSDANPACSGHRYRERLLKMFPGLTHLDGVPVHSMHGTADLIVSLEADLSSTKKPSSAATGDASASANIADWLDGVSLSPPPQDDTGPVALDELQDAVAAAKQLVQKSESVLLSSSNNATTTS